MEALDLAQRFQTPVFVVSDLDLGMNIWMSDPFAYPDQAARSRQGARRRDAGAARRVGALQGRRRRRHPLPHAARHRHAGLLHPRHRPQREGALQRAARGLREQPRSPGAQARDGARSSCRSRSSSATRRRGRHHRLRHDALGDRREPRSAARRSRRSRPAISACARYPFTDEVGDVHRRPRSRLRRRAEPRRPDARAAAAGARRRAHRASCAASALQRHADRRAHRHRRHAVAGRARTSRRRQRAAPSSANAAGCPEPCE